jgi:hypothetical protein
VSEHSVHYELADCPIESPSYARYVRFQEQFITRKLSSMLQVCNMSSSVTLRGVVAFVT